MKAPTYVTMAHKVSCCNYSLGFFNSSSIQINSYKILLVKIFWGVYVYTYTYILYFCATKSFGYSIILWLNFLLIWMSKLIDFPPLPRHCTDRAQFKGQMPKANCLFIYCDLVLHNFAFFTSVFWGLSDWLSVFPHWAPTQEVAPWL